MINDVYNTTKKLLALSSEARCILFLLGFYGVSDFAQKAGVNHETAGAVLGTLVPRFQKHYPILIQIHEALHSAYLDRRSTLNKAARAYIRDWIKRWKKYAVEVIVHSTSPGKCTKNTLDAQRKRDKKKKALKYTLESLKWE